MLAFASLRDLALLCGFALKLAWLLPLVIDAGAAAVCLVCPRSQIRAWRPMGMNRGGSPAR